MIIHNVCFRGEKKKNMYLILLHIWSNDDAVMVNDGVSKFV